MRKVVSWKILLILFSLLVLGAWLANTPGGLLGKADAVGYAICHRLPSHSFFIQERPVSLCARCSGQYLGLVVGLIYLFLVAKKRAGAPQWTVIVLLGLIFLAYLADALNSLVHFAHWEDLTLYNPRNDLRLITGVGVGLDISLMVYILFQRTVWKRFSPQAILKGFREWAGFFLSGALVTAAFLSGRSWILYPLTLVSALGVLTLLTLLYGLIWIIFFGMENKARRFSDLIWPLLGGFLTALLQIAGMDLLRYGLTGTWSGFHIG